MNAHGEKMGPISLKGIDGTFVHSVHNLLLMTHDG